MATEMVQDAGMTVNKVLPTTVQMEADDPEALPVDPDAPEELPPGLADIQQAIKMQLSHGVADGVGKALASVFGDPIDFTNPEVLSALDEIEKAYLRRGRQFFTQLRAEVSDIGSADLDRFTRAAVRVFREIS